MLHPETTAELTRQRRAGLMTDAVHQRLAMQARRQQPANRRSGQLAAITFRLAGRARRLATRAA